MAPSGVRGRAGFRAMMDRVLLFRACVASMVMVEVMRMGVR